MEIRERIAKIIALEGVTAAAFADMVGIQRSNVSHILNGRSGPSLELLQKILSTFPHYNTDWLVMGRGEIHRQPVQKTIFDEIGELDPYADNVPDSADNGGNPAADDMVAVSESETQPAESQSDAQTSSDQVVGQSVNSVTTTIAATVNGTEVEVTKNSDGSYTIPTSTAGDVIELTPVQIDAIGNVPSTNRHTTNPTYDLSGRRVAEVSHSGVYIKAGKKIAKGL